MHAALSNAMDKILARRTLALCAAAAMLATLAACSSSGGAATTVNSPPPTSTFNANDSRGSSAP